MAIIEQANENVKLSFITRGRLQWKGAGNSDVETLTQVLDPGASKVHLRRVLQQRICELPEASGAIWLEVQVNMQN
ncbi:hypothetical protein VTI28DRAFT_1170 [Corynascus sepedonium]